MTDKTYYGYCETFDKAGNFPREIEVSGHAQGVYIDIYDGAVQHCNIDLPREEVIKLRDYLNGWLGE